jgi:hypothetical protein
MGGNGSFWATLGGCAAGLLIGFIPNALNVNKNEAVSVVVFGLCAIGGGIAGYNLSSSPVYEEREISSISNGLLHPDFKFTVFSISL